METLKQVILAIVQGITELLPISSSAHLLLTSQLLDFNADTYFLTTLHIGTTIALLIFFSELLLKDIFTKGKINMYIKILVSSIPAGIAGLLFEPVIEEKLRGNIFMATSLIFWGLIMILTEKFKKNPKEINIEKVSWKESLTMGFAQVLALIPGTSRSGVTTVAGLIAGINKYTALQYSFILGIPVLVGASFYEFFKYRDSERFGTDEIIAVSVATIVGYITLHLLKRFKKTNWLTLFGIYRIILGLVIILTRF
jgi:undecaprenyl-diphosphatase